MKLVFVYNADSGPVSGLFDIGHKLFSPETYQCGLCSLTHDTFTEKRMWKEFRENSSIEMEFLHKDEFKQKYGTEEFKYPIVLQQNDTLEVLLSREEIEQIPDVETLIKTIEEKTAG